MKGIKLKVCGMRDRNNIRDVLAVQPDFIGFIFYDGTPRFVGNDFLIPDNIPSATEKVGVFVNETTSRILEISRRHGLNVVQLHGRETAGQCRELKDTGLRIIKAFSVDDDMDFDLTRDFHDTVDFFLFDTKGKFFGGNARRFNWKALSRYDQRTPFFLSGGITPEHIDEILTMTDYNLLAIDVNSGVEIAPAYKDVEKIKAIKAMLNTKR